MKNKSLLKKLLIGGGIGLGVGVIQIFIFPNSILRIIINPIHILLASLLFYPIGFFSNISSDPFLNIVLGNILNSIPILTAWVLVGIIPMLIWQKIPSSQNFTTSRNSRSFKKMVVGGMIGLGIGLFIFFSINFLYNYQLLNELVSLIVALAISLLFCTPVLYFFSHYPQSVQGIVLIIWWVFLGVMGGLLIEFLVRIKKSKK